GQALDRRDLRAFGLHGENRTGLDGAAVQMNRASAALRGVAADVCTGQLQILAEELYEQGSTIDEGRHLPAVYRHRHGLIHFGGLLEERSAPRQRPREPGSAMPDTSKGSTRAPTARCAMQTA